MQRILVILALTFCVGVASAQEPTTRTEPTTTTRRIEAVDVAARLDGTLVHVQARAFNIANDTTETLKVKNDFMLQFADAVSATPTKIRVIVRSLTPAQRRWVFQAARERLIAERTTVISGIDRTTSASIAILEE